MRNRICPASLSGLVRSARSVAPAAAVACAAALLAWRAGGPGAPSTAALFSFAVSAFRGRP